MKYMNKVQCEERDAVQNVFREIDILASVSHPYLVNIWFTFQDSEDMFMVVDLLVGGDLRFHINEGVEFTDNCVKMYLYEIASALDYLRKKHIVHRDIKPDNLLLDEEGHVHLTDFNVATVLKDGESATSMSGTKPYMAPEVFFASTEGSTSGYSYPVDWWSLGVTMYEVRRGKRPHDIHASHTPGEVNKILMGALKYPVDWGNSIVKLLAKLLCPSPSSRLQTLSDTLRDEEKVTERSLMEKKHTPRFTPSKDHVNCDPTFELEEMIIESKPLHKKKKRLSKQKSLRESQSSLAVNNVAEAENSIYEQMLIYNREQEIQKREMERKELEWEKELQSSMRMSDPTGHGMRFSGVYSEIDTKSLNTHAPETPDVTRATEDIPEENYQKSCSSSSSQYYSSSECTASPTTASTVKSYYLQSQVSMGTTDEETDEDEKCPVFSKQNSTTELEIAKGFRSPKFTCKQKLSEDNLFSNQFILNSSRCGQPKILRSSSSVNIQPKYIDSSNKIVNSDRNNLLESVPAGDKSLPVRRRLLRQATEASLFNVKKNQFTSAEFHDQRPVSSRDNGTVSTQTSEMENIYSDKGLEDEIHDSLPDNLEQFLRKGKPGGRIGPKKFTRSLSKPEMAAMIKPYIIKEEFEPLTSTLTEKLINKSSSNEPSDERIAMTSSDKLIEKQKDI